MCKSRKKKIKKKKEAIRVEKGNLGKGRNPALCGRKKKRGKTKKSDGPPGRTITHI